MGQQKGSIMSENKFIAKLKGEPTPKSVVEIQNDRLVAPFKSSPMGHIADRDSSVVVAKGAQNWAVNQGRLVPVADDYIGTESDLSGTSRVSGAGLWLNATYTFPATGDETNPVSAIIAPSAKWVLTLCGDSLITQNGSVITLTMLVKIGATHLTTKQFKIRECASQFSQRLAIDFSESEQKVIKAHGGSPLTVQVLCDDEGASATIYSGMTHLTLLQRKIDADLVSTDNVLLPEFIENLLEGYIIPADYFSRYDYIEQVEDGGRAMPEFTRNGDNMTFTGWAKPAEEVYTKTEIDNKFTVANAQIDANADAIQKTREDYVKKSGDTMTGDLVFDVVAGGYTVVFQDSYKNVNTGNTDSVVKRIQSNHSVQGLIFSETKNGIVDMQFTMIADGFFMPRGNRLLGNSDYPWENIYAKKLNNGADIAIPTVGGTLARVEDLIDLRADINEADSELQTQITAQAAEIATKQDQLVAGDNIVISGNTISATGAGGGAGLDMQVVDQLPATGEKGVIYLVPKDGSAPDVHDEYVWIDATQTFELIGTTQVDLTEYVKNTDYATFDKAGIIRPAENLGTNVNGFGYLRASYQTLENYKSASDSSFIGKRTLENIKDDYVKRGITENAITLTDEEKTAAQTWLGIDSTGGGGTDLPDQTGNAGKFLTTDGENVSWGGGKIAATETALGTSATTTKVKTVAVGSNTQASGAGAIALGAGSKATAILSIAIGNNAESRAKNAIQLGDTGVYTGQGHINEDANTFKVGNANGNFEMMDASGNVPLERLTYVTDQIAESVTTKDLTVGTDEGTINIGITAGTATIATNNGLGIVAQTKFDTAPTTDDNTTYANALDTSLVRKAQVATAIADAMANVDALPDQAGNAGKFLQTNGATASWAEVPAGGTKVIIKRYS